MNFIPMRSKKLIESLTGAIDPVQFSDFSDGADLIVKERIGDLLYGKRHDGPYDSKNKLQSMVATTIINAIIFVTVIATYDVIRNLVNNYYAKIALHYNEDKDDISQEQINRSIIANRETLISSGVFALICIILFVILIPILKSYIS